MQNNCLDSDKLIVNHTDNGLKQSSHKAQKLTQDNLTPFFTSSFKM